MATQKSKRRTTSKKAVPAKRKAPAAKSRKAPAKKDKKSVAEELVDNIKESLEYELTNKDVRITIKDKRLTFTSWGLIKEMQFGGRVISLLNRMEGLIGPDQLSSGDLDVALLSHLFSAVADDVLDIVSGSISDPFTSAHEARDWIDQECDFKDLFDMGVIIYDQNIKEGSSLGKKMGSLTTAMGDLGKLISSIKQ